MDVYIKSAVAVILASILCLMLAKQGKETAVLLSLAVCGMVIVAAVGYLSPVVDFIKKLGDLSGLDFDLLRILLKCVGIGVLTEISMLICQDAGQSALGKALQISATAAIFWISIPLLNKLLELLDSVLGTV